MKCISIWQPYATLLVRGYKVFETRTWAPPASLIGQRIGIASTKSITPSQRSHFNDPDFRRFYWKLPDMPENLNDLPNGFLIGTAVLDSFERMTPEMMENVSEEERAYGWWQEDFYAWRMTDPLELVTPLMVRGRQGIWDWKLPENAPTRAVPGASVIAASYDEGALKT